MDYDAIVTQALTLLQREQRLSYRVLKLRLQLDDDTLEALKEDLIYAKKLAADEEGRVLVWTGGMGGSPSLTPPVPQPPLQPATPDVSPGAGAARPRPALQHDPVLPTSPRESRFSLAYSHPYERHPMTWRQSCRSRPYCTRNINSELPMSSLDFSL
jgi:hypothetical protein